MNEMTSDRILRLPAVLRRTGLPRSTLYRKVNEATLTLRVTDFERDRQTREK